MELLREMPQWLLVLLLFALVSIVFWALKQGREISFWPPKIGPRKESDGIRPVPTLIVGRPESLPNFDINRIEWDEEECYLISWGLRERVRLVRSEQGGDLVADLSPELIAKLKPGQSYRLELRDLKRNRWQVNWFYLFERKVSLTPLEPKERILQDYAGESDET